MGAPADEIMADLHAHLKAGETRDVDVQELSPLELTFLCTMLVNASYDWLHGKVDGKRTLRVWLKD